MGVCVCERGVAKDSKGGKNLTHHIILVHPPSTFFKKLNHQIPVT